MKTDPVTAPTLVRALPPLCRGAAYEVTTADAGIVLIYDTFATAQRGSAFCEQVSQCPKIRSDFGESLWRSDRLAIAAIAAIAAIRHKGARAALADDFVVLSLRGDEELSDALDRWFAEWMPYARDRELTLVALIDQCVRALACESEGYGFSAAVSAARPGADYTA